MSGLPLPADSAVLYEAASGAWMVDVTSWPCPVDRHRLGTLRDAVLSCFGDHAGRCCPLTGRPSSSRKHPVDHQHVVVTGHRQVQTVFTVGSTVHDATTLLQSLAEVGSGLLVVFYDENFHGRKAY